MHKIFEAWTIDEQDFPAQGSPEEKLAFFARYAHLAPSSYNTQPWQFIAAHNALRLKMDRRFGLSIIDPEDRQMMICVAAGLFLFELSAAYFGYTVEIELFPNGDQSDTLAMIRLGGVCDPEQQTKQLFHSITKRQVNRYAYQPGPLAEDDLAALKKAAAQEGAWLHICSATQRKTLLAMILEADQIQNTNKHFRREIASWLHVDRLLSGDGMPQSYLSTSDIIGDNAPLAVRRFLIDGNRAASDAEMDRGCPVLAVLGSVSGSSDNRIKAGRAYMRVLLTAEARGIASSTLNQPCQVPETRLKIYDELGLQGRAQMVLRLGYPKHKPTQAPRRSFESVYLQESDLPKMPDSLTIEAVTNQSGFINWMKDMGQSFKGFFASKPKS